MFGHEDIWRAIDRLAAENGYSASGLARQAGLDPTSFNKSKRHNAAGKPRWPSTESVAKILAVTGTSMADFISFIDPDDAHALSPAGRPAGRADAGAPEDTPTLPVISWDQAGPGTAFDDNGNPRGPLWDEYRLDRPSWAAPYHFAVTVPDDVHEPVYRAGALLILDPRAALKKDDRVFIRTGEGRLKIGIVEAKTAAAISLRALAQGEEDESLARAGLSVVAKILWARQ